MGMNLSADASSIYLQENLGKIFSKCIKTLHFDIVLSHDHDKPIQYLVYSYCIWLQTIMILNQAYSSQMSLQY